MPNTSTLYVADGVRIGAFDCRPGDPAWSRENSVGDAFYVVFPGTPVVITQRGAEPFVANPNHAIFYNRHQVYRRHLLSAAGDRCVFVAVEGGFVRAAARPPFEPQQVDDDRVRFPFQAGPLGSEPYVGLRLLAGYLRRESVPDALFVDENVVGIVGRVIGDGYAAWQPGAHVARRPRTEHDRAELVERAKRVLTSAYRQPLGLARLAGAVHASPHHLARIFRARTGFSLHEYRTQLRLRASLDLVAAGGADLAATALDLGFASHSHFSDAFRRAFGLSPSAFRAAVHRDGAAMRRAIERAGRVAPAG